METDGWLTGNGRGRAKVASLEGWCYPAEARDQLAEEFVEVRFSEFHSQCGAFPGRGLHRAGGSLGFRQPACVESVKYFPSICWSCSYLNATHDLH